MVVTRTDIKFAVDRSDKNNCCTVEIVITRVEKNEKDKVARAGY